MTPPGLTGGTRVAGLRIALAQGHQAARDIWALRYRAYLAEGVIAPNKTGIFMDTYDLCRTSLQIGVLDDRNHPVGAIRFAVQPPDSAEVLDFRSSPEFAVFPDVVAPLRTHDRPIVSGARLCIEPDHPRRSDIAMLIMIALVTAARAAGGKWAIATARGPHVRFYRRILKMEPACEPRPMPHLTRSYSLLVTDIDAVFGDVMDGFPPDFRDAFHKQHPGWTADVSHALSGLPLRGAA